MNLGKNQLFTEATSIIYHVLLNCTQTSQWLVKGNWSTPTARSTLYPPLVINFKSLTRVSGLQDTYTTFFGAAISRELINCSVLPLRGGSINTTSGRLPSAA